MSRSTKKSELFKSSTKKSERFKVLLPEIYKRLILKGQTYLQVATWLADEKNLDLLSESKNASLFANYLNKYGDIKKARILLEKTRLKMEQQSLQKHFQDIVESEDDANDTHEVKQDTKSNPESLVLEHTKAKQSPKQKAKSNRSTSLSERYNLRTPSKRAKVDVSEMLGDFKKNTDPLSGNDDF